jgi:hypothetical protein
MIILFKFKNKKLTKSPRVRFLKSLPKSPFPETEKTIVRLKYVSTFELDG